MNRTPRYILLAVVTAVLVGAQPVTALASTAPGLGTAASFAVLAGTTVTNTGSSVVTGDLGVHPGSTCTGFQAPCTIPAGNVTGAIHLADAAALSAKTALTTAYGVAASSPCNFNKTGVNLGGKILTPGTYCQTTAPTLTGTLTLSGNGVFIFQIGGTLVTAPGATVKLINGAQPCNVFWQVSSSATLDTTTTFAGTIMALTSIGMNNGVTLVGRAFAQTAAVTLINDRITAPATCRGTTVSGPGSRPGLPVPDSGAEPGRAFAVGALLIGSGLVVITATVGRRRRIAPARTN